MRGLFAWRILGRTAERPLARRVVALVAAYAIALSGLAASFGAARAAADATANPGIIICHTLAAAQTSPATDQSGGKVCTDCCIGCFLLTAALPPPPAAAVALPRSFSRPLALPQAVGFASSAETKNHRSRAPPAV